MSINAAQYFWLSDLRESLVSQLHAVTLPQSMLIVGPEGVGAEWLGRHLAKTILCSSSINTHGACNHCDSCRWFEAGSHPDFISVAPEEAGKAIGVNDIRRLTERLSKTSQTGQVVAFVEAADAMNISASNAILKTLEEPVNNVYLILSSAFPARLLPTIRSRVSEVVIDAVSPEQTLKYLDSKSLSPSQWVSRFFGQQPLQAEAMMQEKGYQALDAWMAALTGEFGTDIRLIVQKMNKSELSVLIDQWQRLLDFVVRELCIVDSSWFTFQDELNRVKLSVIEGRNPNKQLVLETLLMHWFKLSRSYALSTKF